jgi:peroxiredoxin
MAGGMRRRAALASAGMLLVSGLAVAAQTALRPAAAATTPASAPQPRRAAKPVVSEYAPDVPPVFLSAGHAQLCRVLVGDEFPAIELPQFGAGPTKLLAFAGQKATVVLFWSPDDWMSRVALSDIARNVAANARDSSVGVVGVAVGTTEDAAKAAMEKAGAKFSQLLDADGAAFALVGAGKPPRVYVIDRNNRIAWFDIEYSEATRRELQQTLAALTGK